MAGSSPTYFVRPLLEPAETNNSDNAPTPKESLILSAAAALGNRQAKPMKTRPPGAAMESWVCSYPASFPGPLDRVAFSLQEGEISGVAPSPVGFHVLYRPRMEDVRPQFRRLFTQRLAEDGRRRFSEDLLERSGLQLRGRGGPTGPARSSGIPTESRTQQTPSATTVSGRSRTPMLGRPRGRWHSPWGDAAMAVGRLSADTRREMRSAPSGQIRAFLTRLAADHLVWQTARARGIKPDDADRATTDTRFRTEVANVRQALETGEPLNGERLANVRGPVLRGVPGAAS